MAEEDNKTLNPEDINYTTNENSSTGENKDAEEVIPVLVETQDESKEEFVKPKKNILFKILIGIATLLVLLLIIGAILYFTGFFTKEEVKKVEQTSNIEETTKKVEQTPENNYKFDIKDINSKKLNEQLASLTTKTEENTKDINHKKELEKKMIDDERKKEEELLKNQASELEKQKIQLEEKKLELEKEKAQLEAMKQQAEVLKEEIEVDLNKNKIADETSEKKENIALPSSATTIEKPSDNIKLEDKSTNNQFLLFINIAKIKGVLYKKYLDKIIAINPNVKLCRDDKNRIEIYYGPFENNEERSKLLTKLLDNKFNEAYELEFTQEEYDKRCNY